MGLFEIEQPDDVDDHELGHVGDGEELIGLNNEDL